mmetsp:Transcript_95986/g.280567  ORF Transcript_95986/g.280567 Transcript_95986/m.280567 type:complete len:226 (+) Transcript_95986:3-680(+)
MALGQQALSAARGQQREPLQRGRCTRHLLGLTERRASRNKISSTASMLQRSMARSRASSSMVSSCARSVTPLAENASAYAPGSPCISMKDMRSSKQADIRALAAVLDRSSCSFSSAAPFKGFGGCKGNSCFAGSFLNVPRSFSGGSRLTEGPGRREKSERGTDEELAHLGGAEAGSSMAVGEGEGEKTSEFRGSGTELRRMGARARPPVSRPREPRLIKARVSRR